MINNTVIIELKSVRRIIKAHEVQLVNYLVATGKPVGLILNFGEKRVEIKRKVKACPGATQLGEFILGHCAGNIARWQRYYTNQFWARDLN